MREMMEYTFNMHKDNQGIVYILATDIINMFQLIGIDKRTIKQIEEKIEKFRAKE